MKGVIGTGYYSIKEWDGQEELVYVRPISEDRITIIYDGIVYQTISTMYFLEVLNPEKVTVH